MTMLVWLDEARQDLLHAVRLLRRNPIMTATAVLSLTIGIGANSAVFTVASALMLDTPVGVADPGRLVDIGGSRVNGGSLTASSYPTFLDIRERTTTLDGVYAHPRFPHAMSLEAGGSHTERIYGQRVTTNYFTVLGAVPATGRLFDAGDSEQPGASPITVLSHRFWTRRFNRDPAVVGRTIRLNGQPVTIVGVAREGFQGMGVLAGDLWLPLTMTASGDEEHSTFTTRQGAWLLIGARLAAGVSMPRAVAEVEALGHALDREYPSPTGPVGLRVVAASRLPGSNRLIGAFIALLMAIVSLVLMVACANLAGMLLARGAARRKEIAVRLAIGAWRARLVRQLLTETVSLFVLGGVTGLVLARAMTMVIVPLLPPLPMPISVTLALDARVVAFTMGLSLMAALLCGLAPALQTSKANVVTALNDDSHGASRRSRLRNTFVIAQVAFSLVLVVAAGLFVRALLRAGSVDPGFDPRGVELASLDLSMAGYTDTTGPRFARDLIERVRQLPDVQAATIARVLPGGFEGIGLGGVSVPGVTPRNGEPFFNPDWNIVEPGYFATLRIPLVAGRDFSNADVAGAQPVAVIGEGFARQIWPDQNPVGRLFSKQVFEPGKGVVRTDSLLVIGVVRDVKSVSLVDGAASSYVYLPLQQQYATWMTANMTIAARSTGGQRIADQIRTLVASMNPTLPIVSSQTLEDAASLGLSPHRIAASVSGSLGLFGLLLAGIGVYGVTAYSVARRTREFGIRMALGANRADIIRMVLGQGMRLAGLGCAIGLVLAAAASQLLVGLLFGVPPFDPLTFGGTAALFAVIGLAACYGPARRATSVDPLVALRYE